MSEDVGRWSRDFDFWPQGIRNLVIEISDPYPLGNEFTYLSKNVIFSLTRTVLWW